MNRRGMMAGVAATIGYGLALPNMPHAETPLRFDAADFTRRLRDLSPRGRERMAQMMRDDGDTDPRWRALADAIEAMDAGGA